MANCITSTLQTDIKAFMDSFKSLQRECKDIYDTYWHGDANTSISALAGGDPVTVTTKLTKTEFTNGIAVCEQLNNMLQNAAVTTGDYLSHCHNIEYGNDEAAGVISVAVEALGDRLYQLALNLIQNYKNSKDIVDDYFDNEIGDIIAVLDSDRTVWGSEMTAVELTSAITLLQQFANFMDNSAVTQGDYSATVAKWERLS